MEVFYDLIYDMFCPYVGKNGLDDAAKDKVANSNVRFCPPPSKKKEKQIKNKKKKKKIKKKN